MFFHFLIFRNPTLFLLPYQINFIFLYFYLIHCLIIFSFYCFYLSCFLIFSFFHAFQNHCLNQISLTYPYKLNYFHPNHFLNLLHYLNFTQKDLKNQIIFSRLEPLLFHIFNQNRTHF